MYIFPKVHLGSLWNVLSIFSNVLRVIVEICLVDHMIYVDQFLEGQGLKIFDFEKFSIAWLLGHKFFKIKQNFFHSYRNHVINPQISTITLNTFENIEKKFHNDPRKTLGDMYIYFRGDLLLLNCIYFCTFQNRILTND